MAVLSRTPAAQGIDDPPPLLRQTKGSFESRQAAGKLIIRHGPLNEMDMPPMTMAFEVNNREFLNRVKAGDRVNLRVELLNGRFTVTRIERKGQ